jgi:parallel beta-helix repeat protein
MRRKKVLAATVILFLIIVWTVISDLNVLNATPSTIYIRPNGTVEGTIKILRTGDLYTFTDHIYDEIVVQKSNIKIDGNKHNLTGTARQGIGFNLTDVHNVTIQNTNIQTFGVGIYICAQSSKSYNNTVLKNNVTDNSGGLGLLSTFNNTLMSNNFTKNSAYHIRIYYSSNNTLTANRLDSTCIFGVIIDSSNHTKLRNNAMAGATAGELYVKSSSLQDYVQDIDESNTVSSKPICYLVNGKDVTVRSDAGYVAAINSTNITVKNLKLEKHIQNILLVNTTRSLVVNNTIVENHYDGILLVNTTQTRIENDTVKGSNMFGGTNGIHVITSSSNNFSGNNITSNDNGICLENLFPGSNSNLISRNNVSGNNQVNLELKSCLGNVISNNKVKSIISQGGPGGIDLYLTNSTVVFGNNITSGFYGLGIHASEHDTVFDNIIAYGYYGLHVVSSHDNTVYGNNITNNNYRGIYLGSSNDNMVYHNNFKSNVKNAETSMSMLNTWDNGYPSSGNYWDNYADYDVSCGPNQDVGWSNYPRLDHIWDKPYQIDQKNRDRYPLVDPIVSTHVLTITATSGGSVNPAPGTYACPSSISVLATASPANGFFLYCWLLDEFFQSWDNPTHSTLVTMDSDHSLVPQFRLFYGGCPLLYVYDGEEYANESLLNIHNALGFDMVADYTLNTQPKRVNDTYLFQLIEQSSTISHVDKVALYAVLENGAKVQLPMLSAVHSREGNVLLKLSGSDEWKTDLLGADWNDGLSESVQLQFSALQQDAKVSAFIFEIEGNSLCRVIELRLGDDISR